MGTCCSRPQIHLVPYKLEQKHLIFCKICNYLVINAQRSKTQGSTLRRKYGLNAYEFLKLVEALI